MTKELIQIPKCPFCGQEIPRPEISGDDPDILLGKCSCGAVFACDESGKNLGAAFIEALVMACNKDWNMAWEMSEEEDFTTSVIEHYDPITHFIVPSGVFEKRRIAGALYFVRLNKPLEVQDEILTTQQTPESVPFSTGSLSKEKVEELISSYNLTPVISLAQKDRKIVQNLQRLLYSPDPLIRARAAEALGKVCAIVSRSNPQKISRLIQNLLYSIIDTAAFSPGAFEAIAEIIVNVPDLYEQYVPYIWQLLSEKSRRAKAIMALAKISKVRPNLFKDRAYYLIKFLDDEDPEVRGYTVLLLQNLGISTLKKEIARLRGDMHKISVYENGEIKLKSIDELVLHAISIL